MRGWDILPSKSSAQVALFSLLVFGTLTYLHWEAMLISYLSTRKIVLPFQDIPELVSKTQYRIILSPGSSYEDDFKLATDPDWMAAWEDRVKPHLAEFMGFGINAFAEQLETDGVTAVYDNYFSGM